jgi:hypothetical protein
LSAMATCTDAHTVSSEGISKEQLLTILDELNPTCGRACSCRRLEGLRVSCSSWNAAQPGYSKVHTDLELLLPRAAALLRVQHHQTSAMHTVLLFYDW